jgi:hypothetical protein
MAVMQLGAYEAVERTHKVYAEHGEKRCITSAEIKRWTDHQGGHRSLEWPSDNDLDRMDTNVGEYLQRFSRMMDLMEGPQDRNAMGQKMKNVISEIVCQTP